MKHFIKRPISALLITAILGSTALLTGCQKTELEKKPHPIHSLTSSSTSSTTQNTQTSGAEEPTSSVSGTPSEQSSSNVSNAQLSQTSEPQSSYNEELPPPTGESVRICSLSEALSAFNDISGKPVEGTPEEIVKTLMEKNVLCFAAMQGKCWTAEGSYGVQPITSGYITSVEQVEKLFDDTYTENQAWRLMHPQEAGGYGDVFQYNYGGELCFDLSHLRSRNSGSFSDGTYIAVIEADDTEITFGRYYSSDTSGGSPNVQHFKAVKEYGEWRLDTYITDAPAYVQQYSRLITTNRAGNPELMELAKKQVGNIGGRQFWEWCGFDYHIEWCAAFVSWAYAQAGKDGPVFLGCYTGAEWFKERGQWGDRYYADIAPGDSVFFDWNFDGDADHVGLVIGTDGEYVYTVEGNRDDICITKSYHRADYAYIMGYGLMEW